MTLNLGVRIYKFTKCRDLNNPKKLICLIPILFRQILLNSYQGKEVQSRHEEEAKCRVEDKRPAEAVQIFLYLLSNLHFNTKGPALIMEPGRAEGREAEGK